MSKAARSGADVRAARLSTSRKTKEATERALAIATSLRRRGNWRLVSASVYQKWTVEIDGNHYRVESLVSAFLEGPGAPGFVFGVTVRAARGKRAISERMLATPWFQGLQARLGKNYANNHHRPERVSLVRALRGTSDPAMILEELRYVACAIEGKPVAPRRTKTGSPRPKESEHPRDDVWKIIDALGSSGWRISSIAHTLETEVRHDGCRWHVSTGFTALVDSAENCAGFVGTVDSWSTRGEREKRRNPIAKASALLGKNGHRRRAETHYQRWHRGLGLRAANGEIELLASVMRTIVGGPTA